MPSNVMRMPFFRVSSQGVGGPSLQVATLVSERPAMQPVLRERAHRGTLRVAKREECIGRDVRTWEAFRDVTSASHAMQA
jgi:hypothetical protein